MDDQSRLSANLKGVTSDQVSAHGSQDVTIQSALAAQSALENKKAIDIHKKKLREKAEQENQNLWQHPFVDLFKHFKVLPADWKQNKKQGDVQEYFVSYNQVLII